MKKIIICFILLISILFIFNFTRNLILLNKLENSAKLTDLDNCYIKHNMATQNQIASFEIFKKDNTVLIKQYSNNTLNLIAWKNYDTNEIKAINSEGKEVDFPDDFLKTQLKTIIFEPFSTKDKIIFSLFHIIKSKNENITLSDSNVSFSYNINNGTLIQETNYTAYTSYYTIEFGNIEDSDITKPEIY